MRGAIGFEPPHADELRVHFVAFSVPAGTEPRGIIAGRIEQWKSSFDTFEVLADEPREVHGQNGHTSRLQGRNDGDEDTLLTTEVLWIRGSVCYLLKLTAPESEHVAGQADFEELIASFRFLDE